jgi:hypothetical protein
MIAIYNSYKKGATLEVLRSQGFRIYNHVSGGQFSFSNNHLESLKGYAKT